MKSITFTYNEVLNDKCLPQCKINPRFLCSEIGSLIFGIKLFLVACFLCNSDYYTNEKLEH